MMGKVLFALLIGLSVVVGVAFAVGVDTLVILNGDTNQPQRVAIPDCDDSGQVLSYALGDHHFTCVGPFVTITTTTTTSTTTTT